MSGLITFQRDVLCCLVGPMICSIPALKFVELVTCSSQLYVPDSAKLPMPMKHAIAILLTTLVIRVSGHGALISPPSRNAVDRFLPGFIGGKSLSGQKHDGCQYKIFHEFVPLL